jgi:hypothetical protein
MRFRFGFLLAFAILLAVAGIGGQGRSSAQDDPSWKERFPAEAPPAWEKYRKRAKRLQGSIERSIVRLAPEHKVVYRDHFEMKQRDGCALYLAQDLGDGDPPSEVGHVLSINHNYGFELRRQTRAAPWVATNVATDLRNGMRFGSGSHPSDGVPYWANCPTTLAMIPKGEAIDIKDPGFALGRVTRVTRNYGQAVKVEFSYRNADKPQIPSSIDGWVLYDPQHFWVVRECEAQYEWTSVKGSTASATVAYEYEETADGFPIPKRINKRVKNAAKGDESEFRYEFGLKEADVPESDFTLSAFGLPEPGGVRRPIPWYLWAALLGVVCLSAAALLQWRARRRAGRAESPA